MHVPDLWTRRAFLSSTVAAALAPSVGWASGEQTLSNAMLVMPDGSTQLGGIRWANGRVTALGPKVQGGTDLGGQWIVPGFTDAGCRLGLIEIGLESSTHDTSASQSIALTARAIDGYNPRSELIPVARVNGITQALVMPALSGMIPGSAALMRTDRMTLADATIQAEAGLCLNFGRAGQGHEGPKSRIALMAAWRKFLTEHPIPKGKAKKGDVKPDKKVAAELRSGKRRAFVYANRADDIERALAFIDEAELDAVLVGCVEGHLVAKAIADAGLGVMMGPIDAQPSNFQHPHAVYENAAILNEAGVKLAFRSGDAHGVRNLPTLVGLAVAHGLPWDAALRALTVNPMDMLGETSRGRLAVGAEATFFVAEGDPLQPRNAVSAVYMAGESSSMETRQTRLYEQFRELD